MQNKKYKNGDKITLWENQEEEKGQSVVFTYYEPSFEDADLLYNIFQKTLLEYTSKHSINIQVLDRREEDMNTEERQLAKMCLGGAITIMKTSREARDVWKDCLSRCLIENDLFPLGIMVEGRAPFLDRIRMLVLEICIARFSNFTKPHNG